MMPAARAAFARWRRCSPASACSAIWQLGSLSSTPTAFPTALDAIRAIPAILSDKESLINILASLRRMAIGFRRSRSRCRFRSD